MKLSNIANICNGKLIGEDIDIYHFSTDTRNISKGDMFVPIVGKTFDGHKFIDSAMANGASAAFSSQEINCRPVIMVKDTLKAYQDIAHYLRQQQKIPVIGITGSTGKTTTKDISSFVISQEKTVLKTQGNHNNHIGLPETILNYNNEDVMVLEMGMNHLGEISTLAAIANPTIAVITNVGTSHIGNLGSRENILKAKLEITENLAPDNLLILNNDNDLLHKYSLSNQRFRIKTVGIHNKSDIQATNIKTNEYGSEFKYKKYTFKINCPGEHMILDALIAIAICEELKIPLSKAVSAISEFKQSAGRQDIYKSNDITLIDSTYNANYDSMTSSINVLSQYPGRRIAVLGDMLELGEFSEELHRKLGKMINNNVDVLYCFGAESSYIFEESNLTNKKLFTNPEELTSQLLKEIKRGDVILFKASNGMKLNKIYQSVKDFI